MQKMRLFILFSFSCLLLWACGLSEKDAVIHNKIDPDKTEQWSLIKKVKIEEGKIDFYLHDSDRRGRLAVLMHDEKRQRKAVLFDKDLNRITSFSVPDGKGPGELGPWIPGMGMDEEKIYFIDSQKNSIEFFEHDGSFDDSVLIQDGTYRLSFGNCVVTHFEDNYYLGMTYPGSVVKTDSRFNAIGRATRESEFEIEKMFENLARYTVDEKGAVFMVMLGLKGKYEIRKYNPQMTLMRTALNDDGLNNLLTLEICRFPDGSFEANGGAAAISLCVKDGLLYVLRGVAGINDVKWEKGEKKYYGLPIPGLTYGFVDIFDTETLKHIKRVEADFLKPHQDYRLYPLEDRFVFVAVYEVDKETGKGKETSNYIYTAGLEDSY